jgi:hypothetical protein
MLEGTYGHYVWRAAVHDGKVYLCGRRKREFGDARRSACELLESVMLESDDGLVFRKRGLFQDWHSSHERGEAGGTITAIYLADLEMEGATSYAIALPSLASASASRTAGNRKNRRISLSNARD